MDQWSNKIYTQHAGYVSELGSNILSILAPKKDEAILDIGCGEGTLGEKIMDQGAHVVGIDTSPNLLKQAKHKGIETYLMNGEAITFDNQFDAVFSNAALHWMKDADSVCRGVYKSLKKNGRFIAEMGGSENVATICHALQEILPQHGIDFSHRNPWYFPTPDQYKKHLENAGFNVQMLHWFRRETLLPTGIKGWLATFASVFLDDLSSEQKNEIYDQIERIAKPSLFHEGTWMADYTRLQFSCIKF